MLWKQTKLITEIPQEVQLFYYFLFAGLCQHLICKHTELMQMIMWRVCKQHSFGNILGVLVLRIFLKKRKPPMQSQMLLVDRIIPISYWADCQALHRKEESQTVVLCVTTSDFFKMCKWSLRNPHKTPNANKHPILMHWLFGFGLLWLRYLTNER